MTARGPCAEARSLGLKRFFGKICKDHPDKLGERMTSNKRCVACLKIESQKYIKAWRQKNRERENAPRRTPENRARFAAYMRLPHIRSAANERERRRRAINPRFKLEKNLRCLVRNSLRNRAKKSAKTIVLVGCTIDELAAHIEKQFLPGMSWGNQGIWHLDHIQPVASFNLIDPQQQQQCFHFSNMRPLWAHANKRKRDTINYQLTADDLTPP